MRITKLAERSAQGFNLYAILVNDHCLVQEYVDSLDDKNQKQVFTLFQHILAKGPPKNITKFRYVGDNIYELKTRRGVRILCFFGGQILTKSLILTHGFQKSHNRILKRQTEKALKWLNEYNIGQIKIV